jgi:tol-pal system protein YbgF
MARWLALCVLLSSGVMTGCVGEVDLHVLRADMEILQQNYRQHDEQLARQLEAMEMRLAKPRQELAPITATTVGLRAEVQHFHDTLQELRDLVHTAEVTDEMQEKLFQLETRLTEVQRLTAVKEKPAVKRKKPQPTSSQPVAQKQAPKERPIAKRDTPQPAAPKPSAPAPVTVAKAVEPAPVKPSSKAPQPVQPNGAAETAKTTAKSDSNPSQSEIPEPSPASQTPPDETEVHLYERGLRAYQAGNYEGALEFLRHFLNQYAQSPLAGNVQYWIGESLYAQHQYKAAIAAFDHVVQKYPNDTKVPAAILNQGLAFVKLQDVRRARFFLQQVQEKYADSLEADQAKATLQQMQ